MAPKGNHDYGSVPQSCHRCVGAKVAYPCLLDDAETNSSVVKSNPPLGVEVPQME